MKSDAPVTPESPESILWREVYVAALARGWPHELALENADAALAAYRERFAAPPPNEDEIGEIREHV